MVRLTFYDGASCIGGNKILCEADGTAVFLDFSAPVSGPPQVLIPVHGEDRRFFEQFRGPVRLFFPEHEETVVLP